MPSSRVSLKWRICRCHGVRQTRLSSDDLTDLLPESDARADPMVLKAVLEASLEANPVRSGDKMKYT